MRAPPLPFYAGLVLATVAALPGAARALPVPPSAPAQTPPPPAAPHPADAAPDDSRFDTDATLPQHAEDVVDYTLRASLDPIAHIVHGEGTIVWRNTSSLPAKELWVHLYLNAFKNERSMWLRTPTPGARGGGGVKDWGAIDVHRFALKDDAGEVDLWSGAELRRPGDDDETDVRVPLPREVAPGDKITIDMTWDSKLPSVLERTGYWNSFHMVGQWFPKIARLEPDGRWAHFPFYHLAEFYADYGTYDVTLDVPQRFVIGATGPSIDTTIEAGRRIERHLQKDVHDFAWTAWDQWQVEKELIDGVRVTMLYPPSYKAVAAQRELRAMRFALPDFGARYGRYPYEVLTLVHPPFEASEAGGMEYPTLITTGGPWYGPPGVYELELTAIHEFGHQYFYGLIGTNEVEWPFLDEGLNSYAEQLAMGIYAGAGSGSDLFGLTLSDTSVQAEFGNRVAHDGPVAEPAYALPRGADLGGLIYERTGAIFETLRRVYGDEPVGRALGRYARKYRFKHPGPEELLAVFGEVLGPDVERTLRTALFDEGWVDYAVTEIGSSPAHEPAGIFDHDGKRDVVAPKTGAEKGGYEGSVLVQRRGTLSFPFDVDLVRADGSTERVHSAGNEPNGVTRIPYRGSVPLKAAIVDPESRILLDERPTNNFATANGQRPAGAPRTFERVLYWFELLLQTVLP